MEPVNPPKKVKTLPDWLVGLVLLGPLGIWLYPALVKWLKGKDWFKRRYKNLDGHL